MILKWGGPYDFKELISTGGPNLTFDYPGVYLFTEKFENSEFVSYIGKSKTSLKVLDLIEKNPGINSNTIALQLFLNRSTVKYHIDKLKKKNLVLFKHKGRQIELFPNKNFN